MRPALARAADLARDQTVHSLSVSLDDCNTKLMQTELYAKLP
jgi:hypothetical protein